MGEDRCVCCGRVIPEGMQVCKVCWDYDSEDKIPEIGTVERLLFDYGFDDEEGLRYAIDQYQKLITELTYGILSKLTYSADTIMEVIRQHEEDSNEAHYDVDPDHPLFGHPYLSYKCSNCDQHSAYKYRYCPWCGSSMTDYDEELEDVKGL